MKGIIKTLIFSLLFTCASGISSLETDSHIQAASESSADWILARYNSEITSNSGEYLINSDDVTGKARISLQKVLLSIDSLGDQKKYKNYTASIQELSSDGTKLLVMRDRKDAYSNGILMGKRYFIFQIYNLATGQREVEFKREGNDGLNIIFTPDLNAYMYELNSQLHIVDVHTGAARIQNNRNYIKYIYNESVLAGIFSKDGNKRVYAGKTKGIIVTDISTNPVVEHLLPNLKGIMSICWFDGEQILCDLSDNNLYLINIKDETKKLVYHYPDDSTSVMVSTDISKTMIANKDLSEASIIDIKTGKERDLSTLLNKGEDWLVPIQWIKSPVNYKRYI